MSRRFIAAGLLMAAILATPPHTRALAAKKKKADEPAKKADAIDSGKFNAGEFVGLLETTPGSDRMFNLAFEQEKLVATGKGGAKATASNRLTQLQQRVQQARAKLLAASSPKEAQKAMQEIVKAQGDYQNAVGQALAAAAGGANKPPAGFKVDKVKSFVEFQASETVKVRTMVLPEEFDEKGNPKKYGKEELAKLKGKDRNLPGYESSLEKLEPGQKLRVILAARRPVAKAEDNEAPEDKVRADKKMQVKTIIILEESKGMPEKGKEKKKK